MRYTFAALLFFASVQASALNVTIAAKADGTDRPAITGTTNLPDGIELMITLRQKESNYMAQDKAKVRSSAFQAGPFSQKGASLNSGTYTLEVTTPLANLQPPSTWPVIGNDGANLQGPLAKESEFGGKIVEYKTSFNIGDGRDQSLAKQEKAARTIKCSDFKYENQNYHEKMEELAKLARLPDAYYSRYHEDVVSDLCKSNTKEIKNSIDKGFVKKSEVEAIKEALGIDDRSDIGESYGYSRKKFEDMGLCNACADNVAQHYTKKPSSKCGKLAKQALEGNLNAIEELQSSPDYCIWKY